MKPIRLSGHALQQLQFRGVYLSEVVQAIETEPWSPAELGRFECRKDYRFTEDWNGKRYAIKQVRPIFVEEDSEIVVITVYSYFF